MAISENNDVGWALSSLSIRERAMIAVGATVTLVAMAGWLYFLGWIALALVMWIVG